MTRPLSSFRAIALVALALGALGCTAPSRSTQAAANEPLAPPVASVSAAPPQSPGGGLRVQAVGKTEGDPADATVVVEVPEGIEEFSLVALPKGAVGFAPRDASGESHPSSRAHARAPASEDQGDGTHVLSLSPGEYVLAARASGHRPLVTAPFTFEHNTRYRVTGLKLTPGEELAGRVLVPSDVDAEVELEGNGYLLRQRTEEGRFRFDVLSPGTYTLRVTAGKVGSAQRQVTTGGGELEVALEGRCFTGSVKAAGACAACASISAIHEFETTVLAEVDPVGPLPGSRFRSGVERERQYVDTDEQGRFNFCFAGTGRTSVLVTSGTRGLITHDLQPGAHTFELKPLVAVPFRVTGKPRGNIRPALQLTLPEPWSTNTSIPLERGRGTVYLFPELSYGLEVPFGTKLVTRVPKNVKPGVWGAPRPRD